ncbi:MAG: mannose-1-phosphate guanylyltransferase [Bdellovibrionales bacterium]|nr:mannose-1-phosphate guanylyltransferase [Bdellovibrionales bacterium]
MSKIVHGALPAGLQAVAVILAGGSGTRFWPMSRKLRPKQFLPLGTGDKSLIALTADRLEPLVGQDGMLVVTTEQQAELVRKDVPSATILSEPNAKNTGPCIGYAAKLVERTLGDVPMLCVPAEHVVRGQEEIRRTFELGIAMARSQDLLVTIGIKPDRPETGYGYIRRGAPFQGAGDKGVFQVEQFVEKPDAMTAQSYLESGEYFWNSGMFVWRPSTVLAAIRQFMPETAETLDRIGECFGADDEHERIAELYSTIDPISVDVGIMERAENVVMLPGDSFFWSDVGSWRSWADSQAERGADAHGNVVRGDVLAVNSRNCAVIGADRFIATVGIEDLIVVDTGDAVLVCRRDDAQDVRQIIEWLQRHEREELL